MKAEPTWVVSLTVFPAGRLVTGILQRTKCANVNNGIGQQQMWAALPVHWHYFELHLVDIVFLHTFTTCILVLFPFGQGSWCGLAAWLRLYVDATQGGLPTNYILAVNARD